MNASEYRQQGAAAYRRGRIVIPGNPCGWQRRAWVTGYNAEREKWREAHPRADEWGHAAKRSARFCKAMIVAARKPARSK